MLVPLELLAAFPDVAQSAHAFSSHLLARMTPGLRLPALIFDQPPASLFAPAATPARSIFDLSMLVLAICTAIFLIVGGLLLYTLIRYRHRRGYTQREPAQIYGSNQIELSWTVIPIIIVVILFLATARVIFVNQTAAKPANALDVVVIGHQFWWEYRYPKLGIVTANELHVPVSDPAHPTPTYLTMSSADTDHSFWVPRLAGKMDVIPNKINTMWIDPDKAGLYLGQCAQYCGTQHAKMLIRVYADTPASFAAWIAQQQKPARPGRCRGPGPRRLRGTTPVSTATPSPAPPPGEPSVPTSRISRAATPLPRGRYPIRQTTCAPLLTIQLTSSRAS